MSSFDLASSRVIPIEDRGKIYTLMLRAPNAAEWKSFFESILSTSENQGSRRVDTYDSTAARVELVEKVLISADGYRVSGSGPANSVDGWQKKIPVKHRLAAGDALTAVRRMEMPDEDALLLGSEDVHLSAVYSADILELNPSGMLQRVDGLRHRFSSPTAEHQRAYSRDLNRSVIDGPARSGKTRWLGAQATLSAIYDELIVEVEGYTIGGNEITDRQAILDNMDTYHKVAAVEELFAPVSVKVAEQK